MQGKPLVENGCDFECVGMTILFSFSFFFFFMYSVFFLKKFFLCFKLL